MKKISFLNFYTLCWAFMFILGVAWGYVLGAYFAGILTVPVSALLVLSIGIIGLAVTLFISGRKRVRSYQQET